MHTESLTLGEIAAITHAQLIGDPSWLIANVEGLEDASPQDISFLANPRYEAAMQRSKAGAIFITSAIWHNHLQRDAQGRNFLIVDNPSVSFQQILETFHDTARPLTGFMSIHPTAVIETSAIIAEKVTIGPYAVIDKGVSIGSGTTIGAGCYIGPHSSIGSNCQLHPHVIIRERCAVGNRVVIQPGAVIGGCGFGYIADAAGHHQKLNQLGTVILEDDVEIGSNSTIDRARFKETRISRGSKIDNLVQIGHGVTVGEDNIIIAQTGIAGSTKTGRHVILAGHVAIAGHLTLGDGVVVAGLSGVTRSLSQAGQYGGIPAVPLQQYNRNAVHLRNIDKVISQLEQLKKRLSQLEESDAAR